MLFRSGTLSGEHGVGLEKRDYVGREITPATLDLMRGIKEIGRASCRERVFPVV